VDRETFRDERISDLVRGHGAEQMAVLADALVDDDLRPLHAFGSLLRDLLFLVGELRPLLTLLLDRLEVAGSGLASEVFRQKEITGVTILHGHDVTAAAKPSDL